MKTIPLSMGMVALVDDCDYEELSKHKWYAHKSRSTYYAGRQIPGINRRQETVIMHRQILGAPPGVQVDHVDGNGLNNTRGNIRLCSGTENRWNREKYQNNRSGFKGVVWHKREQKWRAQIKVNGEIKHAGSYRVAVDAAHAYDEAAKRYHGEFARLNFPTNNTQE